MLKFSVIRDELPRGHVQGAVSMLVASLVWCLPLSLVDLSRSNASSSLRPSGLESYHPLLLARAYPSGVFRVQAMAKRAGADASP